MKPDTKVVWSHTQRNLVAHFGPRKVLTDITEGDADEFKLFLLDQGLAQATVHKRLQIARQFFRTAKRKKLCSSNPFDEEHYAMVRDEDFAAALEATQNPTQSGAVSGLPALSGGQATHESSLRILGKHAEMQRFSRRKVGVTGFEPVTSSV